MTQRVHRQREHHRLPQARLQVEQVAVEVTLLVVLLGVLVKPFPAVTPVVLVVLVVLFVRAVLVVCAVLVVRPAAVGVQVELGEIGRHRSRQRPQAASALARQRCGRRPGDQHAFGHGLEPDVQLHIGTDRYPGELQTQVVRGWHGQLLSPRGTGLTAERARIKNKRAARRVRACMGHDSVLAYVAIAERALSLPAARSNPNLNAPRPIPGPGLLLLTLPLTLPLTPPPGGPASGPGRPRSPAR